MPVAGDVWEKAQNTIPLFQSMPKPRHRYQIFWTRTNLKLLALNPSLPISPTPSSQDASLIIPSTRVPGYKSGHHSSSQQGHRPGRNISNFNFKDFVYSVTRRAQCTIPALQRILTWFLLPGNVPLSSSFKAVSCHSWNLNWSNSPAALEFVQAFHIANDVESSPYYEPQIRTSPHMNKNGIAWKEWFFIAHNRLPDGKELMYNLKFALGDSAFCTG